ncbi:HNH endonuclease [Cycloclasticus pugetii]|uniref:HNH endonuclease n=1 Tax=Cycloclasticus pugetii TaxID=34068 RepID=UPI003A8EDFEE
MPLRTAKPCRAKLCSRTTRDKNGYCEEHADLAKSWTRGRAGRGRGGRPWRRLRDQVLNRDQHLCQPCKRQAKVSPASQVDHIIPESEGGPTVPSNLEAICTPCHDAKTQREAIRANHQ